MMFILLVRGESSAVMPLPEFPHEISYTVVTEQRSYPIRSVHPPEPMTFPDRSGDVVNFLSLSLLHDIPFVMTPSYFFIRWSL